MPFVVVFTPHIMYDIWSDVCDTEWALVRVLYPFENAGKAMAIMRALRQYRPVYNALETNNAVVIVRLPCS